MKKTILFFLMVTMTTLLTGQSKNNYQAPPTNYFLEKSKNQRDIGFILLGAGTVAVSIPLIIWANSGWESTADINSPAGPISMLMGATMIVVSVPLFIAAGANKRKGMSVSIKNEAVSYCQQGTLLSKNVPSLSFEIGL